MTPNFKYCTVILLVICSPRFTAIAQQKIKPAGNLYSAGYAAAFIDGMYDAWYSYKSLKEHGNFGLGAPAALDGELIMLDNKIYKTQYTGKTSLLNDTANTPYAVVCFFKASRVYRLDKQMNKADLFKSLDSVLTNPNGIYAIHIRGNFIYIKTRAFPPVVQKPYLPLAVMLDKQHFFEFYAISGDLVGYKLPVFMEGPHISGYHFHFLSADKSSGGHILDLTTADITVEVDALSSYTMELPPTADFKNFDFKKDRREEIKSVENGKRQ